MTSKNKKNLFLANLILLIIFFVSTLLSFFLEVSFLDLLFRAGLIAIISFIILGLGYFMISSKIKYYLFYPNNRKIIFKNLMIFLGSNILVGLFFGFKEYSQKATIYLYAGIFFAVVSLFFYILRIYYKKNIGYKRRAHEIALSVETKFIISYVLSIFMMTFYDVLILMNILF